MITVTADIRYLDGSLKGLEIPAGYCVTYPTRESAHRAARWIQKTRVTHDFVRAAVTGNRYEFTSFAMFTE